MNKIKLLFAILLTCFIAYHSGHAQTIEERVSRLEKEVFGDSTITLTYPTRDNVLLEYPSASIIQGLY